MQPSLILYHKLLPLLFIPLCLVIVFFYGWAFYATFTFRGGLSGGMHVYYNLTVGQYEIYNAIIVAIALSFIILQVSCLVVAKRRMLTKIFIWFSIFILLH